MIDWRERVRIVLLMARVAVRARQVVVAIDVAVRTLSRRNRVRTGQRETGGFVIKDRIQP